MRRQSLHFGTPSRVRWTLSNAIIVLIMYVAEFIQENPDLVEPGNAMQFVSDDNGNTYNRCHCTELTGTVSPNV